VRHGWPGRDVDGNTGRVITTMPIGPGVDALEFDAAKGLILCVEWRRGRVTLRIPRGFARSVRTKGVSMTVWPRGEVPPEGRPDRLLPGTQGTWSPDAARNRP